MFFRQGQNLRKGRSINYFGVSIQTNLDTVVVPGQEDGEKSQAHGPSAQQRKNGKTERATGL